jgi:hypothetical protein
VSGRDRHAEGERWLDGATAPGQQALRQALDDAAPPPEDELARQRVWAGVQAPWSARRAGPRWPLVAAVSAAVAATLAIVATRALDRGPLAEGPPALARGEPPPMTGQGPVTAERAARHRLARGVDAELAPRAALVPGDAETPPEVTRGRVRFSVPHQAPGRRYHVRAGAYRVVVLGTEFDVSVEGGAVSVTVASGVVQIEDASGRRLERLAPGESWSSSAAAPAEPAPVPVTPAVRPPPAPVPADAAEALAAARSARNGGDPRRALGLYQRLVKAGGPLAESALFEMATIEHEDLHDPARALATWQRYRDRYPRGVLRAEADLSVIEVLPRLGQEARALAEARDFLRRHPRNERRGEVARVGGDLARMRGDCRAALELYEAAGSGPLSLDDADDAAFGRAACLAALGEVGAAQAARQYRERFPRGRHAAEIGRLPMIPPP